jgi:hypothetical protein
MASTAARNIRNARRFSSKSETLLLKEQMMDESRETRIRERAYSLWQDDGSPDGRHEEHWARAEREVGSDGTPGLGTIREAARQHTDTFLVKSDLEDADQREASPGTREQS